MNKTIVILAAFTVLVCTFSFTAKAEKLGDSALTWTLSDGTLHIDGEGDMPDYSLDVNEGNLPPWIFDTDSITEIAVSEGVTSIGENAFAFCKNVTYIKLPNTIEVINNGAFAKCEGLTQIYLPPSVLYIYDFAFYSCSSLESLTLPENLITIGSYFIYKCDKITEIDLPYNLVNIYSAAFRESKISKISIPPSVQYISACAFDNCINLSEIEIPKSVVEIHDEAFRGCDNLKTVYYSGTENQWGIISLGASNDPLINADKIYYYGNSIKKEYKAELYKPQNVLNMYSGIFILILMITNILMIILIKRKKGIPELPAYMPKGLFCINCGTNLASFGMSCPNCGERRDYI